MAMELRNNIFQKVIDNIEKEGDVLDFKVIEEANERLSIALKGYTEKHPLNITRKGTNPSCLYFHYCRYIFCTQDLDSPKK